MQLVISVVVPVYKGALFMPELIKRIYSVKLLLEPINIDVELIFACDEPVDNSIHIIREEKRLYPDNFVQILELGFNVGQHLATSAGILSARGDWIITMDEDLQHEPERIPELLQLMCANSCDLGYVNSRSTHPHSIYRDQASRISKKLISLITGLQLKNISSYRCIRSEIARGSASSMDRFQYFDILLQILTSPKRRCGLLSRMTDQRASSGYTFQKLLSHFSRLSFSSMLSAGKIMFILLVPSIIFILIALLVLLLGYSTNSAASVPGWLSLFGMQIMLSLISVGSLAITVKMLSILMIRGISPPNFCVIDRSEDHYWSSELEKLLN